MSVDDTCFFCGSVKPPAAAGTVPVRGPVWSGAGTMLVVRGCGGQDGAWEVELPWAFTCPRQGKEERGTWGGKHGVP